MHKVYLNCYFTIAAQEPTSCKLGFLGRQKYGDPTWQQSFTTECRTEGKASVVEVFIRPHSKLHPEDDLTSFSLDTRGWCLQESLLPRRKLCFNGNEMTWECHRRRICECGHLQWAPRSVYGRLGASIKSEIGIPVKQKYRAPQPGRRGENWRALVQEYAGRHLTQPTDKLTAMSGLAQIIAQANREADEIPDKYHAGLWETEFLTDLTWQATYPRATYIHSSNYRAPTWSWASIDGAIEYRCWKMVSLWTYPASKEDESTVNTVVCNPRLPDDATGPIVSAYAVLTGPMVSIDPAVLSAGRRGTEVFLDEPLAFTVKGVDRKAESPTNQWSENLYFGVSSNEKEPSIYCFRLFTMKAYTGRYENIHGSRESTIGPNTWFLVLHRFPGTEDTFKRIGVGMTNIDGEGSLFHNADPSTITII
jgi:hypothetical protein